MSIVDKLKEIRTQVIYSYSSKARKDEIVRLIDRVIKSTEQLQAKLDQQAESCRRSRGDWEAVIKGQEFLQAENKRKDEALEIAKTIIRTPFKRHNIKTSLEKIEQALKEKP